MADLFTGHCTGSRATQVLELRLLGDLNDLKILFFLSSLHPVQTQPDMTPEPLKSAEKCKVKMRKWQHKKPKTASFDSV